MEFWSALFFSVLFFACITRLHAPGGNDEALSPLANKEKPDLSEALSSDTKTENTQQFSSPDDSMTTSQEVSSSFFSLSSELEDLVKPTVAPATPIASYDSEMSSSIINTASSIDSYLQGSEYVLSSVIHIPPSNPVQIQSSQGSQDAKQGTYSEAVLATREPEVLSSVLDSSPPNPISSEPTPTPPSEATPKEEEDSITAALNQAEEETKPKEEEMPSFDEFKRRVLQEEEEKSKQQSAENLSGAAQKPKKLKERKQSNFASVDCGAKILDHNSEASNAGSILVENKDFYMLNPCSAQVWFVVELCDLAQVKSIQIANFELFSSTPESFRVYVSKRFPTREWTMLGTFQAREEREVQTFPLDEPIYAKYFKVEMLSHFGSEHYCPLSLLRVHGSSMMEELEDHEIDGQEDSDNTDSDVPVLPSDPGAKVEDEPKKPNLLERAADTVINLVKKFTGNGHDDGKGDDVVEEDDGKVTIPDSTSGPASVSESQDDSKSKIVTLVGHEELKESLEESNVSITGDQQGPSDEKNTSQGKSMSVNISHEDGTFCKDVYDEEESKTTSSAPSPCQLFSQVVGQYSLGCFMGQLFFSKNKNFTLSVNLTKSGNFRRKTIPSTDKEEKNESFERKERHDQEKIPTQGVTIQEKPSAVESSEDKSTASEETKLEFSVVISKPSSGSVETTSEITIISSLSGVVETVDASSGIVQPSLSIDSLVTGKQKSGTSDDQTPALPEVSTVTSMPLNSTQAASSSATLQSSEVPEFRDSFVDVVKDESRADAQQGGSNKPVQSLPCSGQSTVLNGEHVPSVTEDASQQPVVALEVKDENSKGESLEQRDEQISDKDCKLDGGKEEDKTEATPSPSQCKAPNSLHMMSESSPDIDVLETKLTDKDGREGTAQLPEEVHVDKDPLPSVNGASVSMIVTDSLSMNLEPVDIDNKGMSPDLENWENCSKSTASSTTGVESQSVDPAIQPTSPPIVDTPDISDSVLPLPAPPIISDTSISSQELAAAAASETNLDAAMLSKAQQAAATSAGMSSVVGSGGQKESIFVRLSNKMKALEQNLNMSTLYMEQLHQRYRKSLDDLQKTSDKKVALLTNATKKAEAVINNQKEQITKLQSKVDNLTNLLADMKARMDPLNKEVIERHVIGLCIEIALILVLFILFAKRNNNRAISNAPRGPMHIMNGHGPPRLAIENGRCNKDAVSSTVSSLSGREQLLRSFGNASEPESIGASIATDNLDNKPHKSDNCNPSESKKKRHRKRKASNTPEPPPDSPSYETFNKPKPHPDSHPSSEASSPVSFVSRTAGLLFFGARGFFGGFHNPWKQKKPSSVHSDPNISARTENNQVNKTSLRMNNLGLSRAKSLDLVPEDASSQKHVLPPAPPLPSEFGVMFKRPPDCYYPKKGGTKNVVPGPMKYGKYGVLDTQVA